MRDRESKTGRRKASDYRAGQEDIKLNTLVELLLEPDDLHLNLGLKMGLGALVLRLNKQLELDMLQVDLLLECADAT